MLKTFLIMISGIAGALLTVALLYCVMTLVRHFDKQANGGNTEKSEKISIKNRFKKQLCPTCKTGKESYELDMHSEMCPYVGCWHNGKCPFFVPLDQFQKIGLLERMKKVLSLSENSIKK